MQSNGQFKISASGIAWRKTDGGKTLSLQKKGPPLPPSPSPSGSAPNLRCLSVPAWWLSVYCQSRLLRRSSLEGSTLATTAEYGWRMRCRPRFPLSFSHPALLTQPRTGRALYALWLTGHHRSALVWCGASCRASGGLTLSPAAEPASSSLARGRCRWLNAGPFLARPRPPCDYAQFGPKSPKL